MGNVVEILVKLNKIDVTSHRRTDPPRWGAPNEYRWRLRRGLHILAKLEEDFRRYVPKVQRQLSEGSIDTSQARYNIDSHCYIVFRDRPEQL
ncbi:hypothetical protein HYW41_02720 [Candidatus Daviesbacteria bacterium]|nr:hypothetical protein [Candidatus Daviesbacteria bacterium]